MSNNPQGIETNLEALRWAGSEGLDLSPGDPVCAWGYAEITRLRAQLATVAAFSHWMWHALDDFAAENAQTGECTVEFPADDWKRCNELLDAIGDDPHETLHTILGIGDAEI